jgi:hypothetical protein
LPRAAHRRRGPRLVAQAAGLIRAAASAPKGLRNTTLFWAACRLAEAAHHGLLAPRAAAVMAEEAGFAAGLEAAAVRRTVASAFRTVMRGPGRG